VSPQDLQPARVHASLTRLRELLSDLDDLVGEPSERQLRSDRARRHIAERVLTQLVEIAVSINSHIAAAELGRAPADYRESFELAATTGALPEELAHELRDATGLRNVLVHEYLDIDLSMVAASIPRARTGFAAYVREIARFLRDHAERNGDDDADETGPGG
jgi:uncharacterized protein YutE (UPF0331/DUF86 family)